MKRLHLVLAAAVMLAVAPQLHAQAAKHDTTKAKATAVKKSSAKSGAKMAAAGEKMEKKGAAEQKKGEKMEVAGAKAEKKASTKHHMKKTKADTAKKG